MSLRVRSVVFLALVPCAFFLSGTALRVAADGPADNIAEKVRPVPPPGIAVSEADRAALQKGLDELALDIAQAAKNAKNSQWLPDVQIYHQAVRYALQYNEFFNVNEINKAKSLLADGKARAQALTRGEVPWLTQAGPTVRGYISKIDGSVQPYGLYVPTGYVPNSGRKYRLDTWFHGRGEVLSEVNFLDSCQRSGGPFVRPGIFVVQPYGRYCNANKLAGEVDLLEALDDIRADYPIDNDRIVVRGFSMGGAACWQFAAHYASDWCAAAPGAGFSETPDFLKVFQKETLTPTWWEKKLWQMYDTPYYTPNFANLPTVVYSGENDSQKQAADIMDKAFSAEGMRMIHLIGPKTGHSYHPESSKEINRLIDAIADRGRDPLPRRVRLATPTLKYNRQAWVTLDAMGEHWEVAEIDAEIIDRRELRLTTKNAAALTLSMGPGLSPLPAGREPVVSIDGQKLKGEAPWSDRSWSSHFRRENGRWRRVASSEQPGLVKKHDLQGPIDDAFMDSFVIVRPTGTPLAPGVAKWVDGEMQHAITEWRRQFRGDARVKADAEITEADIAAHNLALWGDPGSNKVLGRIAGQLPIRWDASGVTVGEKRFPATHAPIFVFPNPLNPKKYVVINSGFTYREYDYLNNARQVPKLPDWAICDTSTPPNSRYPGKIVDAGFFDEAWKLKEARK